MLRQTERRGLALSLELAAPRNCTVRAGRLIKPEQSLAKARGRGAPALYSRTEKEGTTTMATRSLNKVELDILNNFRSGAIINVTTVADKLDVSKEEVRKAFRYLCTHGFMEVYDIPRNRAVAGLNR
jgi:hypothetical protein